MLLQMVGLPSSSLLSGIPLYVCSTASLSVPLLTGTWVVSLAWLL